MNKLSLQDIRTSSYLIVTDADDRIEWVNDSFTRITGYTLEESVGRTPAEILRGEGTNPDTGARIAEARAKGITFDDDILNYTKTGEPIWLSIHISPVYDDAGKVSQWISIGNDITQRKAKFEKLEGKLGRRTQELERNYINIKLLSEVGRQITSSHDIESIFEKLHSSVNQIMKAEVFGIRLYQPETNSIAYKYEIESGKRDPVELVSMEDEDNYSVWCIKNKKSIYIIDNEKEYQRYVKEIRVPSGEMPHSLLFCPMMIEERILGLVTVQSFERNAYEPHHLDMLKTLAGYTAVALDNAALYNNLEEKIGQRTDELVKNQAELQKAHKSLTESISYASRIQTAILPPADLLHKLFPDSFVFYRSRDIVGGDLYWVHRAEDKVFAAAIDCTGHGVPGGFMSMLAKNLFDQAVGEKGLDTPSEILTYLTKGLQETFHQQLEDDDVIKDGMDLAVICYNTLNGVVEFAGANNPMYLVSGDELRVIKGNNYGVTPQLDLSQRKFDDQQIAVSKGDMIYLSTDGYLDQFGGESFKKFTVRRFGELLLNIHKQPIDEQQKAIEQQFNDWKGSEDQIDDVCVIGIKL